MYNVQQQKTSRATWPVCIRLLWAAAPKCCREMRLASRIHINAFNFACCWTLELGLDRRRDDIDDCVVLDVHSLATEPKPVPPVIYRRLPFWHTHAHTHPNHTHTHSHTALQCIWAHQIYAQLWWRRGWQRDPFHENRRKAVQILCDSGIMSVQRRYSETKLIYLMKYCPFCKHICCVAASRVLFCLGPPSLDKRRYRSQSNVSVLCVSG